MSDDFIPLNESTPRSRSFQDGNQNNTSHNMFRGKSYRGRYKNRRGNNSWSSSFGSDSNSSFGQDRNNIDAYLHPSMLEDPWEKFKRQQQNYSQS